MARTASIAINLRSVASSEALHRMLMERLEFPGWYGCNWDAFWDAISGLVEMPIVLRLEGWSAFSVRHPRDAQLLKECLDELAEKYPDSASQVVYA